MSLLDLLRDSGTITGLDYRFARAMGRLGGVDSDEVLSAVALANLAPSPTLRIRRDLYLALCAAQTAEPGAGAAVPCDPDLPGWVEADLALAADLLVRFEESEQHAACWVPTLTNLLTRLLCTPVCRRSQPGGRLCPMVDWLWRSILQNFVGSAPTASPCSRRGAHGRRSNRWVRPMRV